MSTRDEALFSTSRLLHVGANEGQEANRYSSLGIQAWHVEAIPTVYSKLQAALEPFPDQIPLNRCLSSIEGAVTTFHIASNSGQSSSMLSLGRHEFAYPSVTYTESIELTTSTIDGLLRDGDIPCDIDYLVIDAQGAEQLILEGAKHFLSQGRLKYALIETAVEPLYDQGSTYLEVASFLRNYGLYLRDVAFNNAGWADAFFQTRFWRPEPPKPIATTGINIAPKAICTQSSSWLNRPCLERMSGNRTGSYSFHTELEHEPWLKLEFQDLCDINQIVVYNREDTCQSRAFNLNIYSSVDNCNWTLVHENSAPYGGTYTDPLNVMCAIKAKQLLFRLRGTDYLHLDKVEVYSQQLVA